MTDDQPSDDQDTSRTVIKKAWNLEGKLDQISGYYSGWAKSYDQDVQSQEYLAPTRVAQLGIEHLDTDNPGADNPGNEQSDNQPRLLDAGCGTGLVGIELQRMGYTDIAGIDLSEEMVEQARLTGSYRILTGGIDLNHNIKQQSGEDGFDIVFCCGVFTLGHVPPQALNQLLDVTCTGGIISVSARKEYCEQTDFQGYTDQLQAQGKVDILYRECQRYIGEDQAIYVVMRKRN